MYKAIALTVLLFGTVSLNAQTSTPVIVAKGRVHQQATIPMTTIFTPTETGLYRLSVYGTVVRAAHPSTGAVWQVSIFWTDDSGVLSSFQVLAASNEDAIKGPFSNGAEQSGATVFIEAVAGTPIMYDVTQGGSGSDNSSYSLYYTLEQLQ